ncbi:MAG: polyprenyl synthetase family protein [Alphaproteobacteria bacterium]|nr:polyprenyl synthetase family protein [Alphaproteobacteria bacterium]
MPFDFDAWSDDRRARVDGFLTHRFGDAWPVSFVEPLRYPLFSGGKRVRPLLAVAACEALGGDLKDVLAPAAAVELIHTYSLVHDDLPAMDDDDERRGRPTVHVQFDEGTAVLVGDALLTEAFSVLADALVDARTRVKWVSELARASGYLGMVGGQVGDITLGASIADVDTLVRVHAMKTGALIQAAVVLGAIAADAGVNELAAMATYGANVGLAFQLADDVLDADEDAGDDGPPSFVRLLGADETLRRAHACVDEAIAAVAGLPSPDALVALARFTVSRTV